MITFDGIIFKLQKHGGISVYFKELFKLLSFKNTPFNAINYNLENMPKIQNNNYTSPRFLERYRKCILKNDTDIFHSTYYRCPDKNYKNLSVVTVHDFLYEKYSRTDKRIIHSLQKNKAIKSADAIICVSNETKKDLLKYTKISNNQKIFVIHNGVSDVFQPSQIFEDNSNKKPYLLYIGNRKGYKNFSLIKDSLPYLQDFDLFIVGGEPPSDEERNLNNVYKNINIKWFQGVDEKTLLNIYQGAFCLLYPSLDEGFGIPIIEAMKCGCPVICLNIPIFKEVAADGGIFIENNTESLIEAISKLVQCHSEQRTKVIKYSSKFSWNITHSKTLDVYDYLD